MDTLKENRKIDEYLGKLKNSQNYYSTIRNNWVKYYKKYRGWLDSDSMKDIYRWRSRLFIPATAEATDGLVQNLYLTFFGVSPFFNVHPREEGDVERARAIESLLAFEFEQSDFKKQFRKFLLNLCIYGTAFGKVYPKNETRKMKRRGELSVQGPEGPISLGYDLVEKEVTVYDGPVFEALDNFDIFVSQKATCLQDSWVIQRSEKTIGQMKELEKRGIYTGVGDLEVLISNYKQTDPDILSKKQIAGLPTAWSEDTGDDRRIEILECWDRDRKNVCTIAGRLKVVRTVENPLYIDPFIYCTLWDDPGNIYGIGVPEKGNDLQDQLNSEVNQRLDNRNLRQNLIIKVRRGSNINTAQLISKPGGVWLTDDMDALEPISLPDISSPNSFAEESLLKQEIEEITGVTKYVKGSGAGGDRTATEASLLARSGSKGFAFLALMIEEYAMKPIIKKYYQLTELFMSEDKIVRILGSEAPQFVKMSPSDVRGDFDFIPAASSELQDRNLRAQQMIQMLQIAGQDPTLNRMAIYKKLWEAWGYKDFGELFNVQQQLPMDIMNQQLQAQAQASAEPPQGPNGPVEATGTRIPSPMEGMNMMALGGGGNAM